MRGRPVKPPIRINEAESIFQRFYDPHRSYLESWRFTCDPATHGRVRQNFHAATFYWRTGGGRVVTRMEKDVAVDAREHDRLTACFTLPATAHITIRAVVDGREQTPIDVRGINTSTEESGSIEGDQITRIVIEVTDDTPDPANGAIYWLGLANSARLDDMDTRPNPFEHAWDDLLVPEDKPLDVKPTLGLMFDADELDALRAKLARQPYAKAMDKLRAAARSYAQLEPWRGVGRWPNMRKPRCYRQHGPEHIEQLAMRLGGFVGLIDDDPKLLRMAANHALALAHCDTFAPEFQPTIAGSAWEQRAFYEYRYAQNLIFAWDFAGCCVTPAGHQLFGQAISTKALPWVMQSLMRHPYVRGCNQGAYFSWGALVCLLALSKLYPLAHEWVDVPVKALDETVNTCFAADGGTFEGVGYAAATAGHALAAYALLARHRGVPVESLVPQRLLKFGDYLMTMISTHRPYGAAIKVADGGREGVIVYPDGLGLLHRITGDAKIGALLAGMLEQDEHQEHATTPGSIFSLVFGAADLPAPAAQPAVFRVLPDTGMLCSNRATPHGQVRLQLIGAPANAGHAHDDRGSFVIEAFDEEIAMERGQMAYDDPRCGTISFARYHNLLIPESPDELLPRQLNPCPATTAPTGEGDAQKLRVSIDVTAAWGELVTACTRRIESAQPLAFTVIDHATLPTARRVSFHVHSRYPWRKTEAGWVTRGSRAQLTVATDWQPEQSSGDEDFIDGEKQPVHHLMLIAPAGQTHDLRTHLHIEPVR